MPFILEKRTFENIYFILEKCLFEKKERLLLYIFTKPPLQVVVLKSVQYFSMKAKQYLLS